MSVREAWMSSDDEDPERVISWAMGDAHRLAGGNALVIDSTCLPRTERFNKMAAWEDLTWNEWKRDEWHPNE